MKFYKILIPFSILVLGFFSFRLFQNSSSVDQIPAKEEVVERILTRMDTLVWKYDSLVSEQIENSGTIGGALAFVHSGEILLLKCFGEKRSGSNDPINEHTIFRLASVSKPITGILAGILDREGAIPLQRRIIEYLPDFRLKDSISTKNLTINHILSHTTGLIPYAYDNLVEAGVPFNKIKDSLFRVNLNGPPGTFYSYQNVAFSLYDTISALATGKSFENLMKEKVFWPFAMKDASVGMMAFAERENKAYPHMGSSKNFRAVKENFRYYNTNPAAGINASISDMSAFLLALLGHSPEAIDTITINEVFTPRILSPLHWNYLRKWNNIESKHYALGWRIIGAYGRQIAYHGGYVDGYRAEIALCREEDFGIALLSNSPNGVESGIIPLFLDLYFE